MTSATQLWLVRHGETDWSRDARHTSVTDLPLTNVGEAAASSLRVRLDGVGFEHVYTSPRLRARRTAELAGFPDAVVDDDLAEWTYGVYEGLTMAQIQERTPGWTIWTHGGLDGESVAQVTARMDRLIRHLRSRGGRVLCFGHGHALRALTARWVGKPVSDGRRFLLDTATISVLGDDRDVPVMVRWNC
jgi:broad specificity phosphatase PhoE